MPPIHKKKPAPHEIIANLLKENGAVIDENNLLRDQLKKTRLNPDMGHVEFNWCIEQLVKIKEGFESSSNVPAKVLSLVNETEATKEN